VGPRRRSAIRLQRVGRVGGYRSNTSRCGRRPPAPA
jgi:hypothetical protein